MRVVVIGGLGNFGARICKRLAEEPGLKVIATSRRGGSGREVASAETAALDTNSPNFAAGLESLAPNLVIHCGGPFQGQDYRVAFASMDCGANYIDIGDGRAFVAGFAAAVGPAAAAAGRFAITPLSTPWIMVSIALYALVGCFWMPVVWLQVRMRDLAAEAAHTARPLPAVYKIYYRRWFALGWPAFIGVLAIFYLMVARPPL